MNMKTRPVSLAYGSTDFTVEVPDNADILTMRAPRPLEHPRAAIEAALSCPRGVDSLAKQIAAWGKAAPEISVAVAVADNTRPVPYSSERPDGMLLPLVCCLEQSGIARKNIQLIVATGTHVATSSAWKEQHLGADIGSRYKIIDHDSTSEDLVSIGRIQGESVRINREFMQADMRIVTGLVEPHFMAGASGGRKMICPGLMNLEATHRFHGPEFMDHPCSQSLILAGNPCHQFALEVADRVNINFSVNATVDSEGRLTAIFCGGLEEAHEQAVALVASQARIQTGQHYELVVTVGGEVAINHYQAAKAACTALPIIARGGFLILVAHNGDAEAIGKAEYKTCLAELSQAEPGEFSARIRRGDWQFIPDQWQAQKWDQCFSALGAFDHLAYCTTNIAPEVLERLPGRSGYQFAPTGRADIAAITQGAIEALSKQAAQELGRPPRIAVIADGPYAVPVVH